MVRKEGLSPYRGFMIILVLKLNVWINSGLLIKMMTFVYCIFDIVKTGAKSGLIGLEVKSWTDVIDG